MNPFQIFHLLARAIEGGRAELFFDARTMQKCCLIGDLVFIFEIHEEGSFTVRHQNLALLWVRETTDWDIVTSALEKLAVDEDADSSDFRRKIFDATLQRLNQIID